MLHVTIEDHAAEVHSFTGQELVEFPSQGLESVGHLHGLGGALYAAGDPPSRLVARVDLPGSRADCSVSQRRHVLVADHLALLFRDLDALDVMQHNRMPHWTGSCAMLKCDTAEKLQIHVELCRAKAEFMARCREALLGHRELDRLYR